VLVQLASWRWIFAVNLLPVGATLLLLRRLPSDTRTPGHVDVVGAVLCALGLAGPVFALIEQPTYGWGNPRVLIPLIAGAVLFVLFLVWERRDPEPMMPLDLFRVRNFAVGNLTTFAMYAGLGVATFFIVLFIQQVGGYKPIEAGLALLPLTVILFTLSRRFGALADRYGPHLFMSVGPLIAGLGLLVFTRTDARASYVSEILPAVLVFGLGLAMTVAPLTATVLGSVEAGHAGLASGVNNAIARVASLIAIAGIGAVIAASFQSHLDSALAGDHLDARTKAAVAAAKARPLVTNARGASPAQRPVVHAALVSASVDAFKLGMFISAALVFAGGVVSLIGIKNPRRQVKCADCPGGALAGSPADAAAGRAQPAPAGSRA
jgi:hypothetical protein